MRRSARFVLTPALLVLSLPTRLAFASCTANCYLVNTASDTLNPTCDVSGIGTCSLRDALTKMALSSNNVIQFAIGTGPQTITLLSNLPDIVLPVMIDGTTQPGYSGMPLIQIRRGDTGTANFGLRTRGPSTNTLTLIGLAIRHFNNLCSACAAVILSDPADLVRAGGHTIKGCYIGRTDPAGPPDDGNTYGIIDNSQGSNTFGGTTPADRNVISGNSTGLAIGLLGAAYSVRSVVQGNYFGTDPTGTANLSNVYGIWTGAPFPGFTPGILIGGSAPGARNLFVSTNGNGVTLDNGTNNVVQNNTFGLDATGLVSLGVEVGIILRVETNATIVNNTIAVLQNGGSSGIFFSSLGASSPPTTGTIVQGNYIGTDVTGNHALPAPGAGIWIGLNTRNNLIGGSGPGQGNVIGGFQDGILITGGGNTGSTGNVIFGNRIGIGINGAPIGNSRTGINVDSAEGMTVIGGINPGEGNIVAFNGTTVPGSHVPGIVIQNGAGNMISGNSIYGNTGLGIDLGFDGVSANDPCDADTGPNNRQNFPVVTAVTPGTSTRIQGTLNSVANTTYRLEFFANATCDPLAISGQSFIGYLDVTTDNSCNATFDVTYLYATLGGQFITATATDPSGNTSEFSACRVIVVNYYTVTPCRVIDTRNPAGPYGGPSLLAGGFRTFVLAGQCGIPVGVTAVSGNIVAVAPTAGPGFLTVYPGGTVRPLAATINYNAGRTRANNVIMRLGLGGDVNIFCQQGAGTVDVVLDVNGYFQ